MVLAILILWTVAIFKLKVGKEVLIFLPLSLGFLSLIALNFNKTNLSQSLQSIAFFALFISLCKIWKDLKKL